MSPLPSPVISYIIMHMQNDRASLNSVSNCDRDCCSSHLWNCIFETCVRERELICTIHEIRWNETRGILFSYSYSIKKIRTSSIWFLFQRNVIIIYYHFFDIEKYIWLLRILNFKEKILKKSLVSWEFFSFSLIVFTKI